VGRRESAVNALTEYKDSCSHDGHELKRIKKSARLCARCFVGCAPRRWELAPKSCLLNTPDATNINDNCGFLRGKADAAGRGTGRGHGLRVDGDADRILAVDEHGVIVNGDELLRYARST
jgi:hypothetical protein